MASLLMTWGRNIVSTLQIERGIVVVVVGMAH
jgi:hypothetical protein